MRQPIKTRQVPLFGLARPPIDLVIDVSNMAYRAAHRFEKLSHQGTVTGHLYGTVVMLSTVWRQYEAKHNCRFVFCLDGDCGWRRDLLPSYKANRGERHQQSVSMVREVIDLTGLLPGLTLYSATDEADDVIATHVERAAHQCVVYSRDRDLWQLSSSKVRIISGAREPPVSTHQIRTDFHTKDPSLIPLAKALLGDASDNIKGIRNFSRADTELLLSHMGNDTSITRLVSIAQELNRQKLLKPRTLKQLIGAVEHIQTMLRITTLRRDVAYRESTNKPNLNALQQRLTELACVSLLDRIGAFYGET